MSAGLPLLPAQDSARQPAGPNQSPFPPALSPAFLAAFSPGKAPRRQGAFAPTGLEPLVALPGVQGDGALVLDVEPVGQPVERRPAVQVQPGGRGDVELP